MVLSAEIRKTELERIRDNDEPIRTEKLFYKDESQIVNVYKIELKYLIFNQHNDRIATQMATWNAESNIPAGHYDQDVHDQIAKFIWNTNPERNKTTEKDLESHGQLRSGVVTLDGVVISGNRRFMLLQRMKDRHYFEAVILDDSFEDNVEEIVRLETLYQYEDPLLEYDPLQKYMKVKRLKEQFNWTPEDIAIAMNEPKGKSEIERLLEISKLMDQYLEYIGCPGLYELFRDTSGTKEGMLVDLERDLRRLNGNTTKVHWDYGEFDVLTLKTIQFDVIRSGDFVGTGKEYRDISHTGSGGQSVFAFKDLWQEFSGRHRDEVEAVTSAHPSLDEYCQSDDWTSRMDAARARDNDWNEKASGLIRGNLGRIEEQLEVKRNTVEPTRLLEKARNLIQAVNFEDKQFTANSRNLDLVREINKLTYEMKKVFEKGAK